MNNIPNRAPKKAAPISAAAVKPGAPQLFIDLIPSTAWGSNVRSRYPNEWDVFRRGCYRSAGHRCEVCGEPGVMECHEVWNYEKPPIQRLERLICLCHLCHAAQHFGLAEVRGEAEQVKAHIRKINGWTKRQIEAHIKSAFKTWDARNKVEWITETKLLDEAAKALRPS